MKKTFSPTSRRRGETNDIFMTSDFHMKENNENELKQWTFMEMIASQWEF